MKAMFRISLAMMLILFFTPRAYCGDPEYLLGFSFNSGKAEITITVVTKGCTQKNDFKFVVKGGTLTILRKKKDECKMVETAVSFTYSLKETGIDPKKPFIIVNRFIANVWN